MAKGPRHSVPYKRKQEEKTDYKKRLSYARSSLPRLIARKTNVRMLAQIIQFGEKGDKTLAAASSSNLKDYGLKTDSKNIPSAYLTGYLLGKIAQKSKINEAIFDIGLSIKTKGSKLFAVLAGAIDSGMKIPFDEKILPPKERLTGSHIKGFDPKTIEEIKKSIDSKVKA